ITLAATVEGDELRIRVADQGRGIPEDKLETIFERFRQVDASDSREKGGSGLGLAISRSIVEQHEGRIWVESVVGVGSTFWIALPMLTELPAEPPSGAPDETRPTVLVCDDEPDVLEVVGAMLEHHGYRVGGVHSGEGLLQQAARERPAAIVLD